MAKGLTSRQRAFVDCYAGNATQAMRQAGYSGNDATLQAGGSAMLRKPLVAAALEARNAAEQATIAEARAKLSSARVAEGLAAAGRIASRDERLAFFTSVMDDVEADLVHRLRAAELLGKACGDFVDRHSIEGKLTLEQLVLGSMGKK